MPYTTAAANVMLDAIGITHVGALTGIPADSGAGSNEVSGGSYARQSISYAAAASKSKAKAAGTVQIPIPAGTLVFFLGGWTALTTGSLRKWAPINGGSVKGVGAATGSTNTIRSAGHGLVNSTGNRRVFLRSVMGESMPSGVDEATLYFVVGQTTDTFQLSATEGGAAIDIGDGELAFQEVIGENFSSAGNLDVTADTMDLLGVN